jgi:spermidine/putrescine transport system ATP-binding protein
MAEQAVILENVTRAFGPVRAADRVSLEIRQGEFFTVLGASGSGKTTTLRLIAGFDTPDEGRVLIGSKDVTKLPAYRRDVHTVFQDYALFPHLTVYENVAFALELRNLKAAELRPKVDEALQLVQLTGFEKRKPSQLSGGQQQRVALARAIVDRPAVLLLDEPLSALDAKIRAELREELKRLQRETRITFIYVTHDQEEALTLSDRLAVMRSGKVLQVGTPIDVYEHPADLFVAEFIGKANFVSGTLVDTQGQLARIRIGDRVVEANRAGDIAPNSPVRVMVRPENMQIRAPGQGVFEAKIRHSLYLGPATEYLVESGERMFRVLELRRRGTVPHAEGAPVSLGWKAEEALVYPEAAEA